MKYTGAIYLCFFLFSLPVIGQSTWHDLTINPALEIPPIDKDDWDYPWYMIRHEDGSFENTAADTILESDTIHIIQNSRCYGFFVHGHEVDPEPYSRLKICDAALHGDSLQLDIQDFSASNAERIHIRVINGHFSIRYNVSYVFPYKRIEVKYLRQKLVLNQPDFKNGQSLKGALELEITETTIFESGKKSKPIHKLFKGTFECTID